MLEVACQVTVFITAVSSCVVQYPLVIVILVRGNRRRNKILLRPKVKINKYFQLDSQSQLLLQVLIKSGMKLIHFASTKVKQNPPQNLLYQEEGGLMRLCHPPDGSTSPKYKQLCFKLP
jgi:hypothetical protein